ncbi:MAG: hypothetical protein R2746_03970 [Acidimicrobiales bacterium]
MSSSIGIAWTAGRAERDPRRWSVCQRGHTNPPSTIAATPPRSRLGTPRTTAGATGRWAALRPAFATSPSRVPMAMPIAVQMALMAAWVTQVRGMSVG